LLSLQVAIIQVDDYVFSKQMKEVALRLTV